MILLLSQEVTDQDSHALVLNLARRSFAGTDASGEDGHLLVIEWGSELEDINFRPIKLWHAKQDVNIASCTSLN